MYDIDIRTRVYIFKGFRSFDLFSAPLEGRHSGGGIEMCHPCLNSACKLTAEDSSCRNFMIIILDLDLDELELVEARVRFLSFLHSFRAITKRLEITGHWLL